MRLDRSGKASAVALATMLLLAAILLAACGSSSSSTAKTTSTAAAGATGSTGKPGARFSALRECLEKQGITLPTPKQSRGKQGSGSPPGGVLPFGGGNGGGNGGGPFSQLPKGVTRAQLEAALKKCGGGRGFRGFNGTGRLRSPAFTKALASFAECMRKNGVAVPKPNTSGKGPIFSTKGIDTTSAKFRTAEQKCSTLLRVARPGASGGAPGGQGAAPGGVPPANAG